MKIINIHNYEEFAIDYMIGNLSATEAEMFTSFLAEHPNIANEVLLFETGASESDKHSFIKLKKEISSEHITNDNFEEYCIAAIEGDLNTDAEKRLYDFIGNNADRLAVKALFDKTILKPEDYHYPNKESLKKAILLPFFGKRIINISATIAAASIIIFGLFFIFPTQNNKTVKLANNTHATAVNKEVEKTPALTLSKKTEEVPQQKKQVIAKVKPILIEETIKTSNHSQNEAINNTYQILEKLRFKKITLPENTIALNKMTLNKTLPEIKVSNDINSEGNETTLRSQTKKILYTTVLAQGVKSINKMAETNVGYDVIEDEQGNPVRIIVKSRFGEINRALAQR